MSEEDNNIQANPNNEKQDRGTDESAFLSKLSVLTNDKAELKNN